MCEQNLREVEGCWHVVEKASYNWILINTLMMLIVRVQVRFCQKFPVKTSKPRDSLSTLENAQDTDAQLMGYMDEEKERLVTWAEKHI